MSSQPTATAAVVNTKTFQFGPDPITVKAGTTVTFKNADSTVHTVVAGTREKPEPDVFSGTMDPTNGSFEHKFDEPGTYKYFCDRHSGPGMTAEVIVN